MKSKKKLTKSTRKWWGALACWYTGTHEWSAWRRNSKHTVLSRWCKLCPKVERVPTKDVSAAWPVPLDDIVGSATERAVVAAVGAQKAL